MPRTWRGGQSFSRRARLLETAAGTGVAHAGAGAKTLALGQPVDRQRSQPADDRLCGEEAGPDERMLWREADALHLPFEEARFDVVVCQFGAMFFPDRVAGYAEARRVLKPGGTFLFNVWDRIENNDFANAVTEAVACVFPDDPPRFLARVPHGYNDKVVIEAELKRAGFKSVSIATIEKTSTAPSARHVALAYCQGTPLRNEIEGRRRARLLGQATERAERALVERFGSGPVRGKIQAHVVVAMR